jgi:hypothetical protein
MEVGSGDPEPEDVPPVPPVAPTAPRPPAADDVGEKASYNYFKVAQGEGAAPEPEHKPLDCAASGRAAHTSFVPIDNYGFLDDDDIVKVYVKLEGDLAGVAGPDAVDFKVSRPSGWVGDPFQMELVVRGEKHTHRLFAEKLKGQVDPDGCKFKVLPKKGKARLDPNQRPPMRPPAAARDIPYASCDARLSQIVVTLKKKDTEYWENLRQAMVLPYRRGGGGPAGK